MENPVGVCCRRLRSSEFVGRQGIHYTGYILMLCVIIAGISLGAFLLDFSFVLRKMRVVVHKNIFPKFKNEQLVYRLLRLIVITVWGVTIVRIGAWVQTNVFGKLGAETITITSSEFSGDMRLNH